MRMVRQCLTMVSIEAKRLVCGDLETREMAGDTVLHQVISIFLLSPFSFSSRS